MQIIPVLARLSSVMVMLAGLVLVHVPRVHAQQVNIILITTTGDDNDNDVQDGICSTGGGNPQCTLRAAVQTANASSGDDRILIGSGTYMLTRDGADDTAARGDLDVTGVSEVALNPSQPGPVTIDSGTSDDPIFETRAGGVLTLSGVTLIGRSDATLRIQAGSARLSSVTVTGRGAVWGIRQLGGDLRLENSTITGNERGGVRVEVGTAVLNGVTIAANGQIQAVNSAGLSSVSPAVVSLGNSILANNLGADCIGAKTWTATNLIETRDAACAGGNVITQDPQLQALAANGGPTPTMAPELSSPVLNAGSACDLVRDQRGVGRPQGGACDLGAFEYPIARLVQAAWATSDVAGQLPIGVRLDQPVGFAIQVGLATSNGSAQAGLDYTSLNTPVNFPAGTVAVTSTLTILDRPQVTGALTLTVALTARPAPVVLPGASAMGVVTIADTSAPEVAAHFHTPSLSAVAGSLAQLQVTLDQAPAVTATVNYATIAGTAQAGVDFMPVTGGLDFAPGQTTGTILIQTLANPSVTQDVELGVVLSAGSGTTTVPPTTAVVTITRSGSQVLRLPGVFQAFSPVREREPNDTTSTATGPIMSGTAYLGAYNGSNNLLDTDVWSFDASAPGNVLVTVTGLDVGGQIWLRNGNGIQLGFAGAAPFTITAALPDAGRYSIGVVSTSQLGAGEYQLRLTSP